MTIIQPVENEADSEQRTKDLNEIAGRLSVPSHKDRLAEGAESIVARFRRRKGEPS